METPFDQYQEQDYNIHEMNNNLSEVKETTTSTKNTPFHAFSNELPHHHPSPALLSMNAQTTTTSSTVATPFFLSTDSHQAVPVSFSNTLQEGHFRVPYWASVGQEPFSDVEDSSLDMCVPTFLASPTTIIQFSVNQRFCTLKEQDRAIFFSTSLL